MTGGNLDALRDSMKRHRADAKVEQMVLLALPLPSQRRSKSRPDDIAEEYKKLAESYKMDEEKVKQMLSEDDIKGNLESRKAAKLIVDAAVAVSAGGREGRRSCRIEGRRIRRDGYRNVPQARSGPAYRAARRKRPPARQGGHNWDAQGAVFQFFEFLAVLCGGNKSQGRRLECYIQRKEFHYEFCPLCR